MRVALGAWGLGSFLASHSKTWKRRFGTNATFAGTLPPMSAVFAGMVEPFPFVLANKVFIDANQYDFLLSGGHSPSWSFNKNLRVFLREFERGGIVSPISYRSILQPKIAKLVQTAEEILDSADLASAAEESRRLWHRFLHSPGATLLPNLKQERAATDEATNLHIMIDLSQHEELAAMVPVDRVTLAAYVCGHDVFDVVAMQSVSIDLDAVMCDWHMYDPLHLLAIRHCHYNYMAQGGAATDETNLRWYIPIPSNLEIEDIWKLREDPFIRTLRDAEIARTVSTFGSLNSPEMWRDLRRRIQSKINNVILNPYNARTRSDGQHIITESLNGQGPVNAPLNIVAGGHQAVSNSSDIKIEHRVLFLAADPTDACRLRLGQEYREIQEKIRLSKGRDRIELHEAFAVRPADLSQSILDHRPTIIHFSGHGSSNGALCFEDNHGQSRPIDADALGDLFRHFADTLQLVVLNACFSAIQASAIAEHVPFVIGMRESISDAAAISFSIGLYQAIGAGRSIMDAHSLGCSQIRLQGIDEHKVPQLING